MIDILNFSRMQSALLFVKKMDELPFVKEAVLQPKDIYLNKISRIIKNMKPVHC